MTYDPLPQLAILREETARYDAVVAKLDMFTDEDDRQRHRDAVTIFRSIADDVEQGEILDEVRCQQILYGTITEVRETRENLEMVAERLGK